jgi:hypothetical protein
VPGTSNSVLAYVGKTAAGGYDPFVFGTSMRAQEVEISDDMYVITGETAEAYKQSLSAPPKTVGCGNLFETDDGGQTSTTAGGPGVSQTATSGDGGKAFRRRCPIRSPHSAGPARFRLSWASGGA